MQKSIVDDVKLFPCPLCANRHPGFEPCPVFKAPDLPLPGGAGRPSLSDCHEALIRLADDDRKTFGCVLADILNQGIDFSLTRPGYSYWMEVYRNLRAL
jgi:hypothetical protein